MMFRQISLSVASVVVLTACASCATHAPMDDDAVAASLDGVDSASVQSESMMTDATHAGVPAAVIGKNSVQFGFDSAAIDEKSQMTLKEIASRIDSTNPERVIVEGHCDERGTREYNLALGDRRAVAAKKYLVGLGVDAQKITTISYGKERPLDPAHTAAAWAKNRRSTVVFE